MLVPVTEAEIAGASNLHFISRFTLMYNFGNFFSYAESADISALDADDFTEVTLAKVTLLM